MEQVVLRKAKTNEYKAIAKIHIKNLSKGFLSRLGLLFLEIFYKNAIYSRYGFCIVAESGGQIMGFVTGTADISRFYREFITKNFFKLCFVLAPRIFRKGFATRIFEDFLYPSKGNKISITAELLTLAVDLKFRNKGVGQALFVKLKEGFKISGVERFRLFCGSSLKRACSFYEKMGGILESEIEVHKGEKSRIYVFDI